ncbi:DUF1415 domain-containing protein [Legionella sp. CNM-4043-24]|uniref:DUF1415 domain-containing protein n=1 Tax=Legionella sp. CNM-4043-24 TaxID=3421646 RepID=UPI00403B2E81
MNDALIEQETMNWIRSFVMEYNICPFASRVVEQGSLQIVVMHETESAAAQDALMRAFQQLDEQAEIETMLLVMPSFLSDFFDYLDFVADAEDRMQELGYEGVYQLATFHPQYCFAGVDSEDVTNYTNRSPYPMLHLLREDSLDKAIDYYGDTDSIPEHNMETLRKLGLRKVQALLKSLK